MLKLYESMANTEVLSLRTGTPIARIVRPIINPNNLHIEAWYVEDSISREQLILLSDNIRDIIPQGFVVDDHDVLSHIGELVRLKEVLKLKFEPVGLKVSSESGRSYGKINDYAFDTSNMYISKLYSGQSIVKNFNGGSLSIDRSQIVEVTNRRIIIEDPLEPSGKTVSASVF